MCPNYLGLPPGYSNICFHFGLIGISIHSTDVGWCHFFPRCWIRQRWAGGWGGWHLCVCSACRGGTWRGLRYTEVSDDFQKSFSKSHTIPGEFGIQLDWEDVSGVRVPPSPQWKQREWKDMCVYEHTYTPSRHDLSRLSSFTHVTLSTLNARHLWSTLRTCRSCFRIHFRRHDFIGSLP